MREYQVHLTSTVISWASFNVAVCALRFFYGVTLGRPAMIERIPYARKRRQLPVILSAEEVARFLAAVPSRKHRTALMTAYAAGLRVSEVVRLKIADIDSSRMLIRVEQGKGGRDLYIMLSPQLLVVLRAYWREARPEHWLFSGQDESRSLDASVLQHHPHIHCLVPGGGLSLDGRRWVSCRPGFFLPVRVLSRLFRRLFLEKLRAAFEAGELVFFSALARLAAAPAFIRCLAELRRIEWVVYA